MALLRGKPLLVWTKEALEPLCREVWLSLREPSQPEAAFAGIFTRVVWDAFPGEGPLVGLLAGLRELSGGEGLLVVSCDQPLVRRALLEELISRFHREGPWAVFCLDERERPEPFPGVYSPILKTSLEREILSGQRALRKWLRKLPSEKILGLPPRVWYPLDKEKLSFRNINSREDLWRIERLLR